MKGKTSGADGHPYFCLGDLWDSFREWSVYGVGSPVLLRGGDSVKQYFAPSLSGIQLYIDPHRPRRTNGDSDDGSSRETCSAGSSDSEAENRAKGAVDRAWNQHSLVNFNSQRMSRLTMGDGPGMSSSGDERGVGDSSGLLVFQYFEHEQPRVRLPLYDKVSELAAHFPELRMYRSCDLMPVSWVSVAWYPIYRIPMGPTLENLEVSFLTFHSLSTHCRSKIQPQFHASTGRKGYGVDLSPKISLPVFALAFCKLRGSILTPDGESEWQQANSLFQAAANWLRHLQVNLPDFQFFLSRWR
ncbi:Protein of unknown function (DUF789) [Quillaja saponaria]|nr:Protein of unknown function (DUF789) [Quillaja saponaria]